MISKYVLVLVTAFLVGCGPQYKTEYSYLRPTTPEGLNCIAQCQNMQLLCNQNKNLKVQNCEFRESRNQLKYDLCLHKNRGKTAEDQLDCDHPFYEYCGIERESHASCQTGYNQCYSNCGGEVSSETTCVANCD